MKPRLTQTDHVRMLMNETQRLRGVLVALNERNPTEHLAEIVKQAEDLNWAILENNIMVPREALLFEIMDELGVPMGENPFPTINRLKSQSRKYEEQRRG